MGEHNRREHVFRAKCARAWPGCGSPGGGGGSRLQRQADSHALVPPCPPPCASDGGSWAATGTQQSRVNRTERIAKDRDRVCCGSGRVNGAAANAERHHQMEMYVSNGAGHTQVRMASDPCRIEKLGSDCSPAQCHNSTRSCPLESSPSPAQRRCGHGRSSSCSPSLSGPIRSILGEVRIRFRCF